MNDGRILVEAPQTVKASHINPRLSRQLSQNNGSNDTGSDDGTHYVEMQNRAARQSSAFPVPVLKIPNLF